MVFFVLRIESKDVVADAAFHGMIFFGVVCRYGTTNAAIVVDMVTKQIIRVRSIRFIFLLYISILCSQVTSDARSHFSLYRSTPSIQCFEVIDDTDFLSKNGTRTGTLVPGTLVPVQRTTDSTGYRLRVVVLRLISFFKSLDSESVP